MNEAGFLAAGLVMLAAGFLRLAAVAGQRAAVGTRLPPAGVEDVLLRGRRRTPDRAAGLIETARSQLGRMLAEAALPVEVDLAGRLWVATLAVGVGAGLLAGGTVLAAVAAAAAVGGPVVAWRLLRRRGRDRLDSALPGAVDAIARALRSGASLRQAVREAGRCTPGPLGRELAAVAEATERGATVVSGLEAWAERATASGVRLVVSALCLGSETGGALAQAVDGVAATLRQRLSAAAEARALATQARVSAAVLATAPLAFATLASVADPRTSDFLLRSRAGALCLAAGLLLDAAGALWMARLSRIDTGP